MLVPFLGGNGASRSPVRNNTGTAYLSLMNTENFKTYLFKPETGSLNPAPALAMANNYAYIFAVKTKHILAALPKTQSKELTLHICNEHVQESEMIKPRWYVLQRRWEVRMLNVFKEKDINYTAFPLSPAMLFLVYN